MLFLKNSIVLTFTLLLTIQLTAQDVTWMPKNKLSKKDDITGITILGAADGEVAVMSEKYLGLLNAESLQLIKEYKEDMTGHPPMYLDGKWSIIALDSKKNGPTCLTYRDLKAASATAKELVCLDPNEKEGTKKMLKAEFKKNGVLSMPRLINSQNRKWYVYPSTNYIDKTVDHYVFNDKLELVYKKKVAYLQKINNRTVNLNYANVNISNEGNIVYYGHRKIAKDNKFQGIVLTYHHKEDKITSFVSKSTKNKVFSPAKKGLPGITNLGRIGEQHNGSTITSLMGDAVVYAGIYKDAKGKDQGIFYDRFDLKTNTFSGMQEIIFSEDILTKINNGKKKSKIKGEVAIANLQLKANGDFTVLFEIDNSQANVHSNTTFGNNYGFGSTEESLSVDLDSRDILYYNFNPDSKLTYSGVIKKHQKKGMLNQTSFVAATVDNTVHVFFNSLKRGSSKIMKYSINADGSAVKEQEVISPPKMYLAPNRIDLAGNNFVRSMSGIGASYHRLTKDEILVEGLDGKRSTIVKIKL